MTLIDDDYLDQPDPEPRRGGCANFGLLVAILAGCSLVLLLVLLLLAGGFRPTSSEALKLSPTVIVLRGTPVDSALAQLAERRINPEAAEAESARGVNAGAPTGSVGTALLGGYATFYDDPKQRIDHYAAAGPLLRDALGHWRGKVIRVQSGQHSTIVRLADFCACGERHGLPTLLDLSPEAFRDLAPLSAGIVRVEIELVELPATDALPRNVADLRMQDEVRDDEVYR